VLYNAPALPPGHPDFASEAGVVAAARAVALELRSRGMKAWPHVARPPVARLVRSLSRRGPDVVFNLIEGFGGHSGGEAWVTSLLELMRLPYTGCPPEAQALCRHKGRTKALLLGSGLPTAPFRVLGPEDPSQLDPWPGAVIVKPAAEDASLGIDQGSVVADPAALAGRVGLVREAHGPGVLVEAYLPGPEYNVGVAALPDPSPLPIAEVAFAATPGAWPILTYRAKWATGSAEDLASPVRCPAQVEEAMAGRLGALAVAAFRAAGCRDYARVDFRLDASGAPMILEINPNPDLDPSAGLARMVRASGRDFGEFLASLARQALERGPDHA
jgi:D-alanine-D-alanine ligase